jgi:GrpB-like predicted nucleotidyltransferase (UPF0157 family)
VPPPIAVRLVPHDPRWAERANAEARRLVAIMGDSIVRVHHIGSTAIPGIAARPILDLLTEVRDLAVFDQAARVLRRTGHEGWGELGIPGRRYLTRDDPATGARVAQVHGFVAGDASVTRHLAFRDYVRAHPAIARVYEAEKLRCARLHPEDSHAYTDAKAALIASIEHEALAWYAARQREDAGP